MIGTNDKHARSHRPPPLRVSGLRKQYGQTVILDAIELELAAGELVILAGPNGAGKSTLLGCVCGTVDPDDGRVEIAGHDLHARPLAARGALRYLPQELEMPRGLTGREWLAFHAELFSAAPADLAKLSAGPLLADMQPALELLAATYSPGMRKRLAFTNLLLGEAALLVLDEPFAGVDRAGQHAIAEHVADALARGAGALLSAHDPEETPVVELQRRVRERGLSHEPRVFRLERRA